MLNPEFIGWVATSLSMVIDIPQIYKIIKTKEVRSISLLMVILKIITLASWLIYGVLISDIIIVCANIIAVLTAFLVGVLYWKYSGEKNENQS